MATKNSDLDILNNDLRNDESNSPAAEDMQVFPVGTRLRRFDTEASADISFVANGSRFKSATDLKTRLYALLTYPKSSPSARLFQIFIAVIIVGSIVIAAVETMPEILFVGDDRVTLGWDVSQLVLSIILFAEWLLRFICYPDHPIYQFLQKPGNIIDFLGSTPIVLDIASLLTKDVPRGFEIFSLLRLFRFIKLAHMSSQVRDLATALSRSGAAFSLMFVIYVLGIGMWAMIIYYAELPFCEFHQESGLLKYSVSHLEGIQCSFQSVIDASWWSVVMMTTVGFGDVVPKTWAGKLVAGIGMITSVMLLSMPLTIVGSVLNEVLRLKAEREAKKPPRTGRALSWISNTFRGSQKTEREKWDPRKFFPNDNAIGSASPSTTPLKETVDENMNYLDTSLPGIIRYSNDNNNEAMNQRSIRFVPKSQEVNLYPPNISQFQSILNNGSSSSKPLVNGDSGGESLQDVLEKIKRMCESEIKENEKRCLEMQEQNDRLKLIMERLQGLKDNGL